METKKDDSYYGLLGVSKRANNAQILTAYNDKKDELLRSRDKLGEEFVNARIADLIKAKNTLLQSDTRAQYDAILQHQETPKFVVPIDNSRVDENSMALVIVDVLDPVQVLLDPQIRVDPSLLREKCLENEAIAL